MTNFLFSSFQLPWWTSDPDLYAAAPGGAWPGHPLQMEIPGTTSTLQPSDELWLAMFLASKLLWWPCCMRNTYIPSSENLIGFLLYILWLSHMISMSNANWKLHNRCSQRLERYKEITVHSNQSASDLSFSGTHWPGHVPRSLPPIIKANQTKKWRIWQFHCQICSWEPLRRCNLSNKTEVLSCCRAYCPLDCHIYNIYIYIII